MTSLVINHWANHPTQISGAGLWWLPGNPAKRTYGTFEFTSQGGMLTTSGELIGIKEPWPEQATILGELDNGDRVTLLEARVGSIRVNNDDVQGEDWKISSLLIGTWAALGMDETFSTLSFRSLRLSEWASSRPRVSGARQSMEVKWRESVRFDLVSLGWLTLQWEQQASFTDHSANMTIHPTAVFHAEDVRSLRQLWDEFVVPFVEFMMLATGGRDGIQSLRLRGPVPAGTKHPALVTPNVDWYTSTLPVGDETPDSRQQHLIKFRELEERLPGVIQRWFELERQHRFALRQFSAVVLSPSGSNEDSFDRTVRALEVWHRLDSDETLMTSEQYGALLDRLADAAPEHSTFIRQRMQYQNAPSLKQRLDALVGEAGEPVGAAIAHSPKFIRRTVDTRNELTHRADAGTHFDPPNLRAAEHLWQLVLRAVLLRRLGFEGSELEPMLSRTPDGTLIRFPSKL